VKAEDTQAPTTSTQRWVLTLTSMASLMVMLDMLVVTTALSTIRQDLGASIEQLEWTVNAYTLSFAVLLMTASALGDRFGLRRLFILGLLVFTAASAACALAPSAAALIAGRAVQGAGSAMIMPHAMALLSVAFPPARRAKALGIFSSITGLATLGGPMVGGAVVEGLDWQWIFWLNVPIGLVLVPLVLRRMREIVGAGRGLDIVGVLLVTGGAFGLVWGLVRGNGVGWGGVEVVGTMVVGALLLVAFVGWELRTRAPMLPMKFFRIPAFSSGNATGFLLYGSVFGAAFFFAQFLQTTLGYSPLGAGLRLAPWTVTLFVVAPVAGAMVNRLGERPLIVVGLVLQAVGFGWIALIASPGLSYPAMIPALMLAGCGVSLAMPAAQNAVVGAVPPPAIGAASGTFNTLRQLGGTLGIAILAAVFAGAGGFASPSAFNDGFVPAVFGASGLSLAAAIAGLWTPRRRTVAVPSTPRPALQTQGNP
jgi:EmrB/QacA subfamily drug resistance transporter